MWNERIEQLGDDRALRVSIDLDSSPVSYGEILRRWQDDPDFRSRFIDLLAESPFSAFRWETPPITTATANRPFECVIWDYPDLERRSNAEAFNEHFNGVIQEQVIEFPNLGNDAIMIVPCPVGPLAAYSHIGSFVRQAPESQKHALWTLVGAAMQRRLSTKPVWLSTAGTGVPWLHVRLDDAPKYYGHTPYREAE